MPGPGSAIFLTELNSGGESSEDEVKIVAMEHCVTSLSLP